MSNTLSAKLLKSKKHTPTGVRILLTPMFLLVPDLRRLSTTKRSLFLSAQSLWAVSLSYPYEMIQG